MRITWKLATAGLAVTAVAAFAIGVTTAYVVRPEPADAGKPSRSPSPAPYRQLPTAPGTSTKPLIYHPGPPPAKPARTTVTVPRATPIADRPDSRPPVAATPPSGTDPVPAVNPEPALEGEPQAMDCTTGQARAWKVARPGILGAVIGAGVDAAGGALADGAEGAGKGALIGGLAGAAAGTAHGAYRTKTECGTVFGDDLAQRPGAGPGPLVARGPAESPYRPDEGDHIMVYGAR